MGDGGVALGEHPPAEEVDGYRDLSVIGHGTTSWVYRAYQERVRRWVALKVLQSDGQGYAVRRRFDRERSLLAELGAHPHIVQVLDAGRTAAARPYVAMDLCDGSVAERVEQEGPLDWPEALDIMVKIAGATQAAHDLGLLHRDIKPQNILVSRYGPMLADFGIARAKTGLGATTGTLQMSPLYAAPEVFFGAAPPSEASDVYSLGASLYALLTGRTPFAGVSDDHVYDYLTRTRVEHPAGFGPTDLPDRLVEVVTRSISADPARRQTGAAPFADELRVCLDGRPLAAAAPGLAVAASMPSPAPAPTEPRRPGARPEAPTLTGSARDGAVTSGERPGAVSLAGWARAGAVTSGGRPGAVSLTGSARAGAVTSEGRPEAMTAAPGGSGVRDAAAPRPATKRGPTWPARPGAPGESWRPAPAPPLWRRLAPAGAVALCLTGLVAVAVAATLTVGGSERTSATRESGEPSTTTGLTDPTAPVTPVTPTTTGPTDPTAPVTPTTGVPTTVPTLPPVSAPRREGAGTDGDPFPVLSGFGLRAPPDAGRYRAIETGHRRTLTAALGVDVPEAQTREVVAGGRVVGFVFAHPLPGVDPVVGERWPTVELPGSAAGSVAATGPVDGRVAASGKNWVASWWAPPHGFVAVFGNEALLRSFLAGWQGA